MDNKYETTGQYSTSGFHDYKHSVMKVAGILWVPTMRSKDILLQAMGGSSWSSPLRSGGSRDDQAGEADPVEL
jgi:hypothetical protein